MAVRANRVVMWQFVAAVAGEKWIDRSIELASKEEGLSKACLLYTARCV